MSFKEVIKQGKKFLSVQKPSPEQLRESITITEDLIRLSGHPEWQTFVTAVTRLAASEMPTSSHIADDKQVETLTKLTYANGIKRALSVVDTAKARIKDLKKDAESV